MMSSNDTRRVVSGLVIAMAVLSLEQCAPAQTDETPFVRPEPFASIQGTDVRSTLDQLAKVLATNDFKVTKVTPGRGEVAATRTVGEGEDRVLIWLEWDLDRHQDLFSVYMNAGSYAKFFGNVELRRVKQSASEIESRFGPLRQAIQALPKGR